MTLPRKLKEYKHLAEVYSSYLVGQAITELLKEIRRLRRLTREKS